MLSRYIKEEEDGGIIYVLRSGRNGKVVGKVGKGKQRGGGGGDK